MKAKCRTTKLAAVAAALLLGAIGYAQADEEDTNITTVAYWKLAITNSNPLNLNYGFGVPDLATNAGQGIYPGTNSAVPASVQDLWILGPMAGSTTYPNDVPPAAMFNTINYYNAGSKSWDCGADEYSGPNGEISCDSYTYGTNWDGPSFTEEVFFKTDYIGSNTPSMDTVKQTLIWNHRSSAYAQLQLNEQGNGDMPPGVVPGSLLFWGWNVVDYPFIRMSAAENGGRRFDDGKWHYACCRYNNNTLTMDLLVVNQDGSSAEASTYIGNPLNPGTPGEGSFIIGNDEGNGTPFDGEINQVRYSNVSLPASSLLANATACNPAQLPAAALVPSTNLYVLGSVAPVLVAPVYWQHNWPFGIQIEGGPITYQWETSGTNIPGATNIDLNLGAPAVSLTGNYTLIASTACDGSVTSAPVSVQVAQSLTYARWSFEFTETNLNAQATVDDVAPLFSQVYNLITFNNSPNITGIGANGEIPLTNTVPPVSMFITGNNGGTNAFNPGYLAGNDGVVFYPAGPDVFDFQTSFSLECFFRTYGDQSAGGPMELICQGSDGGNTFRYGANVNQAGPGYLSFKINNFSVADSNGNTWEDTNSGVQSVVLTNNYADGNWHYLLAQYNSSANTISVSVANADGTTASATTALPVGYGPLPNNLEGNLFVGRYRYPWSSDNRNFAGVIDEVQVSGGLVTPASGQLGFIGGVVTPKITGISLSHGTVTITFTGSSADAPSKFSVVAAGTIGGAYANTSATITSLGSGNFQATLSASGAAEYYRIKR
ncbi:MAG TPA: LamG-like jellyroll fold domain-containing protein [Candidatus Angelobacter sp.]|nr:LamG-like jellyroll fold domain-containing protein [Candidatus Angelobacter sp.]